MVLSQNRAKTNFLLVRIVHTMWRAAVVDKLWRKINFQNKKISVFWTISPKACWLYKLHPFVQEFEEQLETKNGLGLVKYSYMFFCTVLLFTNFASLVTNIEFKYKNVLKTYKIQS